MRTLLYSVTTDSGGMTPSMILTMPPRSNLAGVRVAVRRLRSTRSKSPPRAKHAADRTAHRHVLRRADHAARGAYTARGKPELRADRDSTATGAPQALIPSAGESVKGGIALPEPYVSIPKPSRCTGALSSNAQNITARLPITSKMLPSSEIYPTWPEQAICG